MKMKRILIIIGLLTISWGCKAQAEISDRTDYPDATWVGTDYFTVYRSNTNYWLLPFSRFDDRFQPLNSGLTFLDGLSFTNEATFKSVLNLEIGTDIQAYDADLTTYAGITPSANMQTFLGYSLFSDMRAGLGLDIGTDVQAYDADLTTYAGITPSANMQTFLANSTFADMRTDLDLVISTDVHPYNANLLPAGSAQFGSLTLASGELDMNDVIDMNSNRITEVAEPTASTDAATKNYVDTELAGASQGIAGVLQIDNDANDEILTNVRIESRGITPTLDQNWNLGSPSLYWDNLFVNQIFTNFITGSGSGAINVYQDLDIDNNNLLNVGNINGISSITSSGDLILEATSSQDLVLRTTRIDAEDADLINGGHFTIDDVTVSNDLEIDGRLELDETTTQIASGEITVSSSFVQINTESAAATDDLVTINGGSSGNNILVLKAVQDDRTVVLKDGTGNLYLNGDFSLDNVEDTIILIWFDTSDRWQEISRSDNGS